MIDLASVGRRVRHRSRCTLDNKGSSEGAGKRMQLGFLDNDLIEDGASMCVFPGIPYWIWIGSSKFLKNPSRDECRDQKDLEWMCGCISHETLHDVLNRLDLRAASKKLDTWLPDGRYRRSGLSCEQSLSIAALAYLGGLPRSI